ncbi:hypothetical protein HYT52_03960 [Candidatus Woesearchaeota archaeon]|nr:hypothetical protein [Candidatus Woesearchaeota archaeon]
MTDTSSENILRHFKALAREVGRELKPFYGKATGVTTKLDGTTRCDQDLLASKLVLNHFKTYFPEVGILEEETLQDDRAEGRLCLGADGLDYTRGYIKGTSADYAVLLFALQGFRTVVALSYKPERNEMIWAVEGHGAYLNDESTRIRVAEGDELRLISSRSRGQEQLEELVEDLQPLVHIRMGGSAKYLEVAKGEKRVNDAGEREIVTIGYQPPGIALNPWDLGVHPLIIEEAGGILKTALGNDVSLARREDGLEHKDGLIIANNHTNYERVLEASRRLIQQREERRC